MLQDQNTESVFEIDLDPTIHKTGDVWHVLVRGIDVSSIAYGWRFDRTPNNNPLIHRYDSSLVLLDPYADAIIGGEKWGLGAPKPSQNPRCIIPPRHFHWDHDQPLNIPLVDSVIYEMHVRGYTVHGSSLVSKPGTFIGLTEKIPYLKELGITAVELLPVNEFEEGDTDRFNPALGTSLVNLWGYQPMGFFAPKASYAANPEWGGAVLEFKQMVKAFHLAGIEVILDVVFNHSCEGDERGPTRSFRGIDNPVYYIIDPVTGHYTNFSGCGNTMNCNHPVVRRMISDALQYWVTEMHVDGFRFDLASILGRGQDGSVLANPPLLEELANEPILAHTKLIAEAWDAAGLYQVGTFPSWGRWAEWNGLYRDDVRRFLRGDSGMVSSFATRLMGSPDLYLTSAREPYHSINFVTCHDGFTLNDLVSYDEKHNEANGEENRDGSNENFSWNHGVEGPTTDVEIQRLRLRQQKNFAAVLLLSQGVPMILAGDELGRTQLGNNNAYCQDNEVSWVNWEFTEKNECLLRFFRNLIAYRKESTLIRRKTYNSGLKVTWHGVKQKCADWGEDSRSIAVELSDQKQHIFMVFNAYWEDLIFELPALSGSKKWKRLIDTSLETPSDIADPGKSYPLETQVSYPVTARSVVVLTI